MSNIPFLCHFVDDVSNKPIRKQSTDFREFLAKKLKLLPTDRPYSNKCVLILTTTLDREADVVSTELLRRGIDYLRLNAEDVHSCLTVTNILKNDSGTECQIKLDSLMVDLSNISAVWLRDFDYGLIHSNCNDLNGAFVYQQWSDALQILFGAIEYGWINSADATSKSNNRLQQLIRAKQLGFNVPSTLITNDPDKARRFYQEHNQDIIVKVLHHHDVEVNNKIYSIHSHIVDNKDLSRFEDLIYSPCILQERIHFHSELRVTVVKDKVFSVQLDSNASSTNYDDIHRIPLSRLKKTPVQLEKDFEQRCIQLIDSFGLDYGAIDFVIDKNGRTYFLEVNPTGGWLWIEHGTGLPITRAVVDLLEKTINAPFDGKS